MITLTARLSVIASVTLATILAPLAGVLFSGDDPMIHLRFPPRPMEAAAGSFLPVAFVFHLAVLLAVAAPFVWRVGRSPAPASQPAPRAMPAWGWMGLALLLSAWAFAWWPEAALADWRRHSFTPLWLGYIVFVNAWTARRRGRSLLAERPARFLALFPASAAFWYLFEYLNQFTGNWVYAGVGAAAADPSAWLLRSALPFSTVLPAVLGTRDLLATVPRLSAGLERFRPVPVPPGRSLAVCAFALATLGLAALGAWPETFYSLLWLAPLALIVAAQSLAGESHLLAPLARGDWREVWLAALAALLCGLFWEMWNSFSVARWHYHIPYVEAVQIFEMPMLGYAGYLPFGLICVAAAQLLTGIEPRAVGR